VAYSSETVVAAYYATYCQPSKVQSAKYAVQAMLCPVLGHI